MNLIKFLLENIFIVVIIVGFVTSLFGKASSKKKSSQRPDFGGGGSPEPLFPQMNEQQTQYAAPREPERQQSTQSWSAASRPAEGAYERQESTGERRVRSTSASKASANSTIERPSNNQAATAIVVKQDDVRKAVVWAELLGPPRSKRPYGK